MKHRRPMANSERGMSLMEVIIAIVLIGIVSLPLLQLAKANLKSVAAFSQIEKAQFDLKSQMEQVLASYRALGYDAIKVGWEDKTGKTVSGSFNYHVQFGPDQVINGITCSTVTVTLTGGTLKQPMMLKTMISKQ
ncbi:prepilin-type N-terminal cleavage/methylation domain-containing protein [bacterium]|nr:prepilin-type N-terminal cleavage/methylation domain-containing protein [bacterium]